MNKDEIEAIVHAIVADVFHHRDKEQRRNRKPWFRNVAVWGVIMGIPAFIGTAVALWISLGFPTIATSADIQRLDRQGAEIAVQSYQNALNNLIATTPPEGAPAPQLRAWQQQYDLMRDALNRAIQRKSELTVE